MIYVLEVNPRASRTVPFVAKATDSAIASIAARLMAGEPLSNFPMRAALPRRRRPRHAPAAGRPADAGRPATRRGSRVKEAVLPFARFPGVDPVLGPEMRSTGEVMGWDRTFAAGLPQGADGRGHASCPTEGRVFLSVKDMDKTAALADAARDLIAMGFEIVATSGTAAWLAEQGVAADAGQQGLRRPPEHRRPPEERRHRAGDEHDRRHAGGQRQPRHPPRRADGQDPLLHHRRGERRRRGRDEGAGRGVWGADVAGVKSARSAHKWIS